MLRMNWMGTSEPSSDPRYRNCTPPDRLTQEQTFHAAGYQSERIRKIFLNSDIEYRHFYLEGPLNREESSDQLKPDQSCYVQQNEADRRRLQRATARLVFETLATQPGRSHGE
jgi:hypothetical protein